MLGFISATQFGETSSCSLENKDLFTSHWKWGNPLRWERRKDECLDNVPVEELLHVVWSRCKEIMIMVPSNWMPKLDYHR